MDAYRVSNITIYGLGPVRLVKHPNEGCIEIWIGQTTISIYGQDDRMPDLMMQSPKEATDWELRERMKLAGREKGQKIG